MPKPIEAVVIGAGSRGYGAYGRYALENPAELKIIAVAEPDAEKRARFAAAHGIAPEMCFTTWEEVYARPQLAPALLNCTMDRMHTESTLPALRAGYNVFLEKPMAVAPQECAALVRASEKADRLLMIGHVLRYAPFWDAVHGVISSGRLGQVMTVDHRENVSYWHMGHSFVRGNWGNSTKSAPMILAKSCHDLDILLWILNRRCLRLASFGSLTHYRAESATPDLPERCTDGCPREESCPWNAPRLYLTENTSWPTSVISVDTSLEARRRALETGPWGRCIYRCDNDVVDHQVIIMEMDGGLTVTFTMHGHSHLEGRTMRYDGTEATLIADGPSGIQLHNHMSGKQEEIVPAPVHGGHGGGDAGIMRAFVGAVRNPGQETRTSARASLQSHLMAFAAERSRRTGEVIDMAAYAAEIEGSIS
jgi:predicted dehydrogenase